LTVCSLILFDIGSRFAAQHQLSVQGRGSIAKVTSLERKAVLSFRRVSYKDKYELEYDGYHGALWDNGRSLEVGEEIPVLYLESNPASVTRGTPGDSTWHLMMQRYGWVETIGTLAVGSCCGVVPLLLLAMGLLHSGIRNLAHRTGRAGPHRPGMPER